MFIYIIPYLTDGFDIFVNGIHYEVNGQDYELLVKYLLKSYPESQYNYVIDNPEKVNQYFIDLLIQNGLKQHDELECRELRLEDLL